MPKFIAVHTLPFNEKEFLAQAKELAKLELPKGLNWSLTYCAFGEHKFFCEWEAPTKEALKKHFKQIEIPYDAIHSVKLFDVAKGKMK